MYKNYSTIGNFRDCLLVNTNYGYDVCMYDGIDKGFAKGPGPVDNLGPGSPNCQAFLAEQCSVDWNPNCELYYRTHNQSLERYLPNTYNTSTTACQGPILLGDTLLLNSAKLRFFDNACEQTYAIPLDPTNYSSPMITRFVNKRPLSEQSLSDRFDVATIDSDAIMCRMLQNPKPFLPLLYQIYLHVQNNIRYGGTPDVNGQVCNPHYVKKWDIRGTRTWTMLCNLFVRVN
jgi:hypothetical protein